MPKKFDYTSRARRIALRFPVFNYIAIQVNFWILAFLLLSIIIHFTSLSLADSYSLPLPASFLPSLLMSIIIGIIYGSFLGLVDIIFEKGYFKHGGQDSKHL